MGVAGGGPGASVPLLPAQPLSVVLLSLGFVPGWLSLTFQGASASSESDVPLAAVTSAIASPPPKEVLQRAWEVLFRVADGMGQWRSLVLSPQVCEAIQAKLNCSGLCLASGS